MHRAPWLAAILVLATALRVAHVLALRAAPWFDHLVVDRAFYDSWARRLAAGDWLGGDRAFYMDPLYPYFLGALYAMATPVRTLDAIHLATALMVRERTDDAVVVLTHDGRLSVAARALGFAIGGAH